MVSALLPTKETKQNERFKDRCVHLLAERPIMLQHDKVNGMQGERREKQ